MTMRRGLLILGLLLVLTGGAEAACKRSDAVRRAFVRTHPCPATGLNKLPCYGFILDHIIPLCANGPDGPNNLQWQSIADAKAKDRDERRLCRTLGKRLCALDISP